MDPAPRILFCVAAPAECRSVLEAFGVAERPSSGGLARLAEGVDLLATGVGPTVSGVNAAAGLAAADYSAAISLGIGGAYPDSGVELLQTVLSTRSVLADQGRQDADSFAGLAEMGFGPFAGRDEAATSPELVEALSPLADRQGPVATVGAASGSDARAAELEQRSGAIVEAMEGAAVHLACLRAGVAFAELRVISNRVGDRGRHPWRLAEALDRLGPLAREAAGALRR